MDIYINTEMFGKQFSFEQKCHATKKAGFCGVEIWFEDLDVNTFDILRKYDLKPISLIGLKGWFEGDGSLMGVSDSWNDIFCECQRRIDLAAKFCVDHVVCVPSRDDRGRYNTIQEGVKRYKALLAYANLMNVELLFEFVGASGQINDIRTLNSFFCHVDQEMSVIIDSYHLWRSGTDCVTFPLPTVKLLHVSNFDLKIPRQSHRDRDRIFPEVGDFNWGLFFHMFKELPISLGAYNRSYWEVHPDEIAKKSMQAAQAVAQCKYSHTNSWSLSKS